MHKLSVAQLTSGRFWTRFIFGCLALAVLFQPAQLLSDENPQPKVVLEGLPIYVTVALSGPDGNDVGKRVIEVVLEMMPENAESPLFVEIDRFRKFGIQQVFCTFSAPANFSGNVIAKYLHTDGSKSNAVIDNIKVVAPKGEEAKAKVLFDQINGSKALVLTLDATVEVIDGAMQEKLKEIVKEYKNTEYGRIASYLLGRRNYIDLFRKFNNDGPVGAFEPANLHFRDVRERSKSKDIIWLDASHYLMLGYALGSEFDKAEEIANEIISETDIVRPIELAHKVLKEISWMREQK